MKRKYVFRGAISLTIMSLVGTILPNLVGETTMQEIADKNILASLLLFLSLSLLFFNGLWDIWKAIETAFTGKDE
jgi:hypothetical protein